MSVVEPRLSEDFLAETDATLADTDTFLAAGLPR